MDVADFDDLGEDAPNEEKEDKFKVVLNLIVGEDTPDGPYTELERLEHENPFPILMTIKMMKSLSKKKIKFVSVFVQGFDPSLVNRDYFEL